MPSTFVSKENFRASDEWLAGGGASGPSGPTTPKPTIASVTPFSFPVNTGLVSITVAGTGFTDTDVIQIDGTAIASTTFVSATELTGQVQTDGVTPASGQLTVVGPGGSSYPPSRSGVEFV